MKHIRSEQIIQDQKETDYIRLDQIRPISGQIIFDQRAIRGQIVSHQIVFTQKNYKFN